MKVIAVFSAFWLAACQTISADKPKAYLVDVGFQDTECTVAIDGMPVPVIDLEKHMKQLPDKSADIHIRAVPDTPYRCLGGAIYQAQLAGFIRIGFVTTETKP